MVAGVVLDGEESGGMTLRRMLGKLSAAEVRERVCSGCATTNETVGGREWLYLAKRSFQRI